MSRETNRGHPVHRTTTTRAISIGAGLISLLLVTLLVTRASNAAFTDTTENVGSSFSAGSIALVDDDSGSAMFTAGALAPGNTLQECITVTSQGTVADPAEVRLYSGGQTDGGLATHLDVTIEEGTGGSSAACGAFSPSSTIYTGTLAAFDTTHSSYGTGAGVWDPSSTPDSITYRFTVTLGNDTPNSAQGADAVAAFTWEVQS